MTYHWTILVADEECGDVNHPGLKAGACESS